MTIRELHVLKLAEVRRSQARHAAECTDDKGECMICDGIDQEIDRHREALDKIDAGTRQMRIANQ